MPIMMSILPTPATSLFPSACPKSSDQSVELHRLDNLSDAVEPFEQMIVRRGLHSVRLHCTIPMWCPTSDACGDLHDLHDLRARFLLFIHNLIASLRSSGISASYSLSPSDSPMCLLCAVQPDLSASRAKADAIQTFRSTDETKRDTVLLGELQYGPALIIA